MNLEKLFFLKAIVSLAFGIALTILPTHFIGLYGVELSSIGALLAQFFGAALIGIGLICWSAKSDATSVLSLGIALSLCVADTIGFIVSLIGQIGGITNNLGWITVAFWFIFASGLGYFRFLKPPTS